MNLVTSGRVASVLVWRLSVAKTLFSCSDIVHVSHRRSGVVQVRFGDQVKQFEWRFCL